MRLFIAVYPPAEAADDLAHLVSRLHVSTPDVNTRLARRDTWHVTLAFLGEVPDERAGDAATAVTETARDVAAPELRIAGGGRFGRGRFTILWAGVRGDLDPLATRIRRELKRSHVAYDRKPFRPHLTIARPGDRLDRGPVDEDRATLAGYQGPAWTVDTIELVRSHLGPKPTYERIHSARLS
ncbi:RNA 2',3'-cyclic phosphodiesterase [Actinoplanes sp. TBRC 11911]|uniref:RNA 2',3'-cyclic phosphodiesterase n=1 Tax=Actinoplanes sp. TBRC 11911 TaxID=2729386 RepID=UPI00145CCDAF|nr:RNA 2',3'-cyclic phosphodiesterase [Actinoplanes sp. TBRC 11911]NMO51839.1 RNA 2',3'-cyclic phosphodiesterase [Actinoplanes sp. TBRC 11911]